MNLTPEEQILRATRESLKEEKTRRERSEEELQFMHKTLSDIIYYIDSRDSRNKNLLNAYDRINEYLRKIGIIS